jgi:uncharacterized protein YcfJ
MGMKSCDRMHMIVDSLAHVQAHHGGIGHIFTPRPPAGLHMNNKNSLILVAGGALLVGGIATAAFMSSRSPDPVTALDPSATTLAAGGDALVDDSVPAGADIAYADVLNVVPVRESSNVTAAVVSSTAVTQAVSSTRSEETCQDVVVQERAPERDGNVGGTVAGALIGGLVGNQVGGGNGRKAATVAGAVAGGVIGNQVDKRHVGGRVTERTERQCQTRQVPVTEDKVVGYDVTYRTDQGVVATQRMDSKPGQRITLDSTSEVVGYDVTYRYQGTEQKVRLDQRPQGDRLQLIDGQVAAAGQ